MFASTTKEMVSIPTNIRNMIPKEIITAKKLFLLCKPKFSTETGTYISIFAYISNKEYL